ncbi:hypothetical protein [Pseudonocardia sp. D17]|uniref:hypothetical protein n=1 Tax=Pseudonocardia sp. D17 TaxID=882661 RepID=UPI0030CE0B16
MARAQREMIEGRPHINRAAIEQQVGISEQTQANLYAQRETNGHPEGVRIGRVLWFDEEKVLAFYCDRARAKQASLTEVDRGGDPGELCDVASATKVLGYTSESTIRAFLAANPGYFPEPDHVEFLPSGRLHRLWKRSTLWEFADGRSRPGRRGRERPKT